MKMTETGRRYQERMGRIYRVGSCIDRSRMERHQELKIYPLKYGRRHGKVLSVCCDGSPLGTEMSKNDKKKTGVHPKRNPKECCNH